MKARNNKLHRLKSGNILIVKYRGRDIYAYIMTPDGIMVTPEGRTDEHKVNVLLAAFKS